MGATGGGGGGDEPPPNGGGQEHQEDGNPANNKDAAQTAQVLDCFTAGWQKLKQAEDLAHAPKLHKRTVVSSDLVWNGQAGTMEVTIGKAEAHIQQQMNLSHIIEPEFGTPWMWFGKSEMVSEMARNDRVHSSVRWVKLDQLIADVESSTAS